VFLIHIAIVGKYTGLSDAYLSLTKALIHAALNTELKVVIDWVETTDLEQATKAKEPLTYDKAWKSVLESNGILVPGGFGDRGIEGKIAAIHHARTTNKPFLGICLGMQVAVIETARNTLGWDDANSTEFNQNTEHKVVIYMPEISKTHMGGTMRLGKRRTVFKTTDCVASKLYYNAEYVDERHRHRYEVNPEYINAIEKDSKLRFVGQDESGTRMEVVELLDHPFFLGVQYHPEFKSRPLRPSPPFVGLVLAAAGKLKEWLDKKQTGTNSPSKSRVLKDSDGIARSLFS